MIFRTNFLKSLFLVENTKNEHHYWILLIQISLSTNFQLKLTIVIFWTKFSLKSGYFQSKTDKIDATIEFFIFELVFVSNFTLNKQFWIFTSNFPKKDVNGQKLKIEHHHEIPPNIWISLGSKFQLKPTISTFLTRIILKEFFWSKTEKVNTTYFLHNCAHSN